MSACGLAIGRYYAAAALVALIVAHPYFYARPARRTH
jgi:hypothetical protein